MNTSLKPWVQYWIYSWLGVPKTAVGGWKCCQRTSGLLRTKHKPEKYRAYAAQVQFQSQCGVFFNHRGPQVIIQGKWVLWFPILDIYIYIWNLPGGAYTFGQSTCETFRQLQLHQIFLLRHSIAWALPGDRFDRQGVLLHGCGTDVPWLVPIKGAATRWSKTQNQNDENWVADGGSNGRPYFFKLHLRLDDSSSSWRAMLSAELSNVGVLPMVTIAHFMQLQSVQGGDRLGNRWLCRMKTWCQMCVSSGNQT